MKLVTGLGIALGVLALAVVLMSAGDIRRYLKIRSM